MRRIVFLCGLSVLFAYGDYVAPANELEFDMVFVKSVLSDSTGVHVSQVLYNTRFEPGGNLFVLRKDGSLENLTQLKAGAVADPEVSYDGTKILFSMMKDARDYWHIYEINADGTGLTQLTFGEHDDIDPCYLPDGKITFCSNRAGTLNEYEMQMNELLHIMDGAGQNIRQTSFFLSGDYNPMVMNDGRLLWMRYEHQGRIDFFPLVVGRPDGSNVEEFFGVKGPIKVFHEFTQMPEPDGRVIATAMWHFYTWEAGALVAIDPDTGPTDYQGPVDLTPGIPSGNKKGEDGSEASKDGRYRTPRALQDGRLLASWADGPVTRKFGATGFLKMTPQQKQQAMKEAELIPDFGIWMLGFDEQNQIQRLRKIYNDPDFADIEPIPLLARPKPPAVPSAYDPGIKTGEFLCMDVYENSLADRAFKPEKGGDRFMRRAADPWKDNNESIKRGDIKSVRIVEGLPVYAEGNTYRRISHYHHEPKRILGEAPVYEDGSFRVDVPVDTPIHFQTLDENGRVLSTQLSWIYLQPGENKLCIGCHEERGSAPSNVKLLATAAKYPATVIPPASDPGGGEIYHFVRDVYPIIKRRCGECHIRDMPAGEVDFSDDVSPVYNVCYDVLLPWIRPGSVRKTELTRMMMGRRDKGECGMGGTEHGGYGGLTAEEWEVMARWVELGVMFRWNADGQVAQPFSLQDYRNEVKPIMEQRGCLTSACHGEGNYSGAQWTANFSRTFSDSGGGPITPIEIAINITHPERSRLLMAPRHKIDNNLTRQDRENALELFNKNCGKCHPYTDVYTSKKTKCTTVPEFNRQVAKCNSYDGKTNLSVGQVNLISRWLAEFAGRAERPTCPNIWEGTDDEDYKKILTFLEEASVRFVGETDPYQATLNRCNKCHKHDTWKAHVGNKTPDEWKKVIMRMLGQQPFGHRPSWGIRPPEAALIHDYLRRQSGGAPITAPPGSNASELLDKARTLRFAGDIDEAELKCRQALAALPAEADEELERRIRLELGVIFTQYGYPVLNDEMRASRFIPRRLHN